MLGALVFSQGTWRAVLTVAALPADKDWLALAADATRSPADKDLVLVAQAPGSPAVKISLVSHSDNHRDAWKR